MSWPRGSNISPVRIQSCSLRKCWRRSNIVAPSSAGIEPPATTRTGLPQVWPSMQKKLWRVIRSGRDLEADLGELRPARQRRSHDRLDMGVVGPLERQPRRTGERRAAAHDRLAQLDALHEVGPRIEMEERHEPLVERHRLLVAAGAGEAEESLALAREGVRHARDP